MSLLRKPPVWIGGCLLVLAAFVLHQFPHPTEMTLSVITPEISFVLPGSETAQPLIEGLPLTSLTLGGSVSLAVEVEALHEQGHDVAVPGNWMQIRQGTELALNALPEGELRLVRLDLAGASEIILGTDRVRDFRMEIKSPQPSELELAILGRRFALRVFKENVLLDGQDHSIPLRTAHPPYTVEVTSASSRLMLEPETNQSFSLAMQDAEQSKAGQTWDLFDAIGRIRMTRVSFIRSGVSRKRRAPVVKALWSEPRIPEKAARKDVLLKLRQDDVFTLRSLKLSDAGLLCEFVGTTKSVLVGQEQPHENLVPSWLEYIVKHVIFQTLCKPLGLC